MPVVLTLLRIKNLALLEELEWLMEPGFIAVTGETGAGKSIIIGALQLLLGERADKSLIRTAKTKRAICRSRNRAVRERSHP
jgi:DNA repair protein RecN (Recombination protein N)